MIKIASVAKELTSDDRDAASGFPLDRFLAERVEAVIVRGWGMTDLGGGTQAGAFSGPGGGPTERSNRLGSESSIGTCAGGRADGNEVPFGDHGFSVNRPKWIPPGSS